MSIIKEYKLYHPLTEITETLTFYDTENNVKYFEYDFDELEGDSNIILDEFIKESSKWILYATTDEGCDNGYGELYLSKERNCICALNSYDDPLYAWNVGNDIEDKWNIYSDIIKHKLFDEGGFVDWLMNRENVNNIYIGGLKTYFDTDIEENPYKGAPKKVCNI